jgi:hypothetical protein
MDPPDIFTEPVIVSEFPASKMTDPDTSVLAPDPIVTDPDDMALLPDLTAIFPEREELVPVVSSTCPLEVVASLDRTLTLAPFRRYDCLLVPLSITISPGCSPALPAISNR